MDMVVAVAGIVVLALAAAPMLLMRGQYGKRKVPPGSEGGDGGGVLSSRDTWTGARSKSDAGHGASDGGDGDGGGGD